MNIYFSGLGGVGIGPLAQIARDAGYGVQGSDAVDNLMTRQLREQGVTVQIGQDGSFLRAVHAKTPLDWFVYTAALPADHPELVAAHELGIRTAKRDELLAHIIAEKNLKLIAVAGTHGKTTTSGMLVWTLQQLGVPVSYSVGTTLSFGPSGQFDPTAEYFVYECDEFDRNFLHFHPYLSLITALDYDHPDTYPTEQNYHDAFRQFGEQSRHVIAWRDQASDVFSGHPNAQLLNEPLDIHLAGVHNRRNATLVLTAIEYFDFTPASARVARGGAAPDSSDERESGADRATGPEDSDLHSEAYDGSDAVRALQSFPGTDRRFEKLADNLYTDYGHHPVEIAATLQLARELSDHVVLVYQPHQNIRQHEIRDAYTDQFELAEHVYWLPTYLSREDPALPILTPEELMRNITNKDAHITDLDNEFWDTIQRHRDAGHLVLCMGAGSIDGWVRERLVL